MGLKRRKIYQEAETILTSKGSETIGMDAARKLRFVISPPRRFPNNFLLSTTTLSLILCLIFSLTPGLNAGHPFPRGPPPPHRDIPLRLTPHKHRLHNGPPPPRFSRESPHPPFPPPNMTPRFKGDVRNRDRDLATAAQTLYDLRGYNIPLGGQEETQRFLRQNDPFNFARFQPRNIGESSRTAPLVFPSFYQEQRQQEVEATTAKRPQGQGSPVLNIFGHTQHLSQTKYEPAGSGHSSNGNIAIQSQPQTFRPSQIDLGFAHQLQQQQHNEVTPSYRSQLREFDDNEPTQLQGRQVQQPQPQALAQVQNFGQNQNQNQGQPHQILNYRAPGLDNQNQVQDNQNHQNTKSNGNDGNSNEEPFIYVYDDEDYDEGDEEFVDKPQQQINSNRVTTPSPRSHSQSQGQIHFPSSTPSASPTAKPLIQVTTTLIPISHHRQPDFFSQIQAQPQNSPPQNSVRGQQDPYSNYNGGQFPSRFSPTITPTPNVEINPSSERKPPPDQSNSVTPISPIKPSRVINDDRFRRPLTGTGNNFQQPQIQQQYYSQNNQQQAPQNQNQNQRQPFNQVVNLVGEEDDGYDQDPEIIQKLNGFPSYDDREPRPENKLRPVNTLVPKNRVPVEEFVLPPNFPFHEDYTPSTRLPPSPPTPATGPSTTQGQSNRGDIIRQNFRPQQQDVSPAPPPPPQHRLRPTSSSASLSPSPTPTRGRPTPTRTTTTTYFAQEPETEPPKRVRGQSSQSSRPVRPTPPSTKIHTFPPFPTSRRATTPTTPTTVSTTFRTTPAPRTTTTTTTESYEADSDEYYDDDEEYSNSGSNSVEGPPTSRQTAKPISSTSTTPIQKSPIRPDFYNNNNNRQQNQIHIQELHSPKGDIDDDPRPVAQPPPRRNRPQGTPSTTTPSAPRYYQPTQGTKRFREQATIESPPKPGKKTTTGKPLYYAGKMLSREGGVYAGRIIPPNHVYGKPVPNVPINSVFDRMPAILEGHVTRARVTSSPLPQVVSPAHVGHQNRIRGREQQKERQTGLVSSTPSNVRSSTHKNTRLIHPSRIRTHANPPSPPPTEREPERESVRPRPKPRPRTTTTQSPPPPPEVEQEEQEDIPIPAPPPQQRRRKIRPGQKKLRQQLLAAQQESVTISHSVQETDNNVPNDNEDDQDRPEPPRKALRPKNQNRPKFQSQTQAPIVQILQSQSVSTSSTESSLPNKPVRVGRPRPRPTQLQKQVQILQSQSQRSTTVEDDVVVNQDEEVSSPAPRPQKRIRPRAQKPKFQPQPDYSEVISKSVSTQASVKIGRKPTEAPNRFSSRFRETNSEPPTVVTSTRSSVSESDHGHDHDHDDPDREDDESPRSTASGLKHFSPPPKSKPRPSFKPPTTKTVNRATPSTPTQVQQQKPKRIKPKQNHAPAPAPADDPDDDLPPSIRLSAKDVVLNRKPARRIPPGSASDRLKALAERRKKIATAQSFREAQSDREEEEGQEDQSGSVQEGNRGHRTLRRRKLLNNARKNNNANPEEEVRQVDIEDEPTSKKPLQQRRVIKKHRIARLRPAAPPQEEEIDPTDPDGEKHHDHESDRDFQQNKREITNKHSDLVHKEKNNLYTPDPDEVGAVEQGHHQQDYPEEYDALDNHRPRPRPLSQRAYERVPFEASSDEARSVLGIVLDKGHHQSENKPISRPATNYEDPEDDYEGHPSHMSEQKVSTSTTTQDPLPPFSPASVIQLSSSTLTYDDEDPDLDTVTFTPSSSTSRDPSTTTPISTTSAFSSTTSSTQTPEERESSSSSTTEGPTSTTTAAYLKARLRPNKKLLSSLQPKLSANQQRNKNESARHTNLSKLLKFRTSSSTYSPISNLNSKLFTMATEDPSLPLEDMFSNVNKSS